MALTSGGAVLTQAHRSTQAKTGALVAYAAAKLWMKTVKRDNLEESTTAWMRLVRALLLQQRSKSVTTTRVYYPAFRKLELPNEPMFQMPKINQITNEQIFTALRVTGPIAYQKAVKRVNDLKDHGAPITPELEKSLLDSAFESASKTSGAAAMRLTLDGGRDQLQEAARSDKLALGWARVTRGTNACYFCRMLSSRGFTYGEHAFDKSNTLFTGDGTAKVHDGCQCAMEPSFSRDSELPGTGQLDEDLWISSTAGKSGKAAIKAFRRAVEGR